MNIAVTGASGYVGRAIATEAEARGHASIALSRQPVDATWREYHLGAEPAHDLLDNVGAVIHCAYDLSLTDPAEIERVNVQGTRLLVGACRDRGIPICLISSMSAYPGTRQVYGQTKLAAEQEVLDAGGLAVRLGLVYGGEWGGMAGTLRKATGLRVVPLIGAKSHQFTVHVDDMSRAIVTAVEAHATPPSAVGLAHPQAIEFEQFVRGLAVGADRSVRVVRVPWQPVHAGMVAAERLGLSLPLRSDSVMGLIRPAPYVPGVELWRSLGVEPQPFDPHRL